MKKFAAVVLGLLASLALAPAARADVPIDAAHFLAGAGLLRQGEEECLP